MHETVKSFPLKFTLLKQLRKTPTFFKLYGKKLSTQLIEHLFNYSNYAFWKCGHISYLKRKEARRIGRTLIQKNKLHFWYLP